RRPSVRPPVPPLGAGRGEDWTEPPRPRRPAFSTWSEPLTRLPGVGAATAERADGMGIATLGDLLEHLPARYEAYDEARPIAQLVPGEEATVRVRLESIRVRPTRRRRLRIVQARVRDRTGALSALWFNPDYLARTPAPGDELLLRGTVGGPPLELTVK